MKKKVFVIIGPTAVGKTKLAVQLARAFGFELVSCDSMKVYKGLDIAASKLILSKSDSVKYHMLDICSPLHSFTVNDYCQKASKVISRLHSNNKVPLVVGGTFYYVESLIFDNFVNQKPVLPQKCFKSNLKADELYSYDRLCEVDPKMAQRLHPNDTRKITNSLVLFDTFGISHSDLLSKKVNKGINLKFDTVFLWITCDALVLEKRLNKRVDNMVEKGLFEEIFRIRKYIHKNNTKGQKLNVCQAIGYKELTPFFDKFDSDFDHLSGDNFEFETKLDFLRFINFSRQNGYAFKTEQNYTKDTLNVVNQLVSIGQECINQLKLRTKQYTKVQLKWIRNRILSNENVKIFRLDSTDCEGWDYNVYSRAHSICENFLDDKAIALPEYDKTEYVLKRKKYNNNWQKHFCEICGVTCNGLKNWEAHLKSKGHRAKKKID